MPGLFPGQIAGQELTPVAVIDALLYLGSEAADLLAAYRGEAERPPTAYEVAAWANRRNLLATQIAAMWPDQDDLQDAAETARLDWQQADAASTHEAVAKSHGQDPDAALDREWARRAT